MKNYKNYLLAGSGFVILLGSFILSVPRPTQGQGGDPVGPTKPVMVVNTPSEPVPVTGSITGDVNVANTVRVSDVRRRPFNETFQLPFAEGQDLRSASFIVPPGKQLVVTFVSANASLPAGQAVTFSVRGGDSGSNAALHRLVLSVGSSGSSFVTSEPLQLYLDAGEILTPIFRRSDTTGGASANAAISGYLVDVL